MRFFDLFKKKIVNQSVVPGYQENGHEFFSDVSSSGMGVTSESAKRCSAVYACRNLISGVIASLPCNVYLRNSDGSRESVDHDYWWLLNEQPNVNYTSSSFWEFLMSSMTMRGGGIAELVRDRMMNVKGINIIPDEFCEIKRLPDGGSIFMINDGVSRKGKIQEDILYFPNIAFDGKRGESVIKNAARQSIGTALSADEYAGQWFKNGAVPSIVIKIPSGAASNKEQRAEMKQQFQDYHGNVLNRHKPFVLFNGAETESLSITPEDSQLLETRQYQTVDIARAFGVPPHMIGVNVTSSYGTGLEQISKGFHTYTINPILRRNAQELNRKLWPKNEKFVVDFDRSHLLEGDLKTEAQYYAKALGGPGAQGWMTVNEVRKKKNLPKKQGHDDVKISGTDKPVVKPPLGDKNEE